MKSQSLAHGAEVEHRGASALSFIQSSMTVLTAEKLSDIVLCKQRELQQRNRDDARNAKNIAEHANDTYSSNSLIHKSNRLLSQQLSVWWKASANIIVVLVLTYEATSVSNHQSVFRCSNTYGVDERLLKYCFLGLSSRFSTCMRSERTMASQGRD